MYPVYICDLMCPLIELFTTLQVNLEYLARVVFNVDGLLYPDSLVGTDSHTTMINGLGVLGWGECNCCIV